MTGLTSHLPQLRVTLSKFLANRENSEKSLKFEPHRLDARTSYVSPGLSFPIYINMLISRVQQEDEARKVKAEYTESKSLYR